MNRTTIVVKPDAYQAPLKVVGTDVTVLAARVDTQGQEFTYQTGLEGMGPPPHSHAWDETFFVLKGSVEFTCAGKSDTCRAGTLVFVPGGTVHSFKYGAGGGEMLEITGSGSKAAEFFAAIDAEIPPGPPDLANVERVSRENGVSVHL